jgi:esterase/lipase superfamily enzyme
MAKHFLVTNREVFKSPDGEYLRADGGEHAGHNIRFGIYDSENEFALKLIEDVNTDVVVNYTNKETNLEELKGSERFFKEIYAALKYGKPHNELLFFVHGFNVGVEDLRKAIEALHDKYVLDPNCPIETIVAFSWPARKGLFGGMPVPYDQYWDDAEDAKTSGRVLARFQEKLIVFFKQFFHSENSADQCGQKLHLLVHSMGNHVLNAMVTEWQNNDRRLPNLFTNILLVAADVDYDFFEHGKPFANLIDFGNNIHIFFHEWDKPLATSKWTKNGLRNRLGQVGRRENNPRQPNIHEIDVTEDRDDNGVSLGEQFTNHGYFITSSEAIKKIKLALLTK